MSILEQFNFIPNAAIIVICFVIGMALKGLCADHPRVVTNIPWILAIVGAALGIIVGGVDTTGGELLNTLAMGAVSGFASGGIYQAYHQQQKNAPVQQEELDLEQVGLQMNGMLESLNKLTNTVIENYTKDLDE